MPTTLSSRGQITIPKPIRDALGLQRGAALDVKVNDAGEIVIIPAVKRCAPMGNRFAAARGTATVEWRTDDLMDILRG